MVRIQPRLSKLEIGWIALSFVPLGVLVATALALISAGNHADVTATITPDNEGLWIRAVIALVLFVIISAVWTMARVQSRHPVVAAVTAVLFGLSSSLLAFDLYWWFAAGSYADMVNKDIPRSNWKTYPVMGLAFLASFGFGIATLGLLFQRDVER